MIASTKGRYALWMMIDLAEHPIEGYIPLREIAERQEISEKYMEIILKMLVKEKFLVGLRGKKEDTVSDVRRNSTRSAIFSDVSRETSPPFPVSKTRCDHGFDRTSANRARRFRCSGRPVKPVILRSR